MARPYFVKFGPPIELVPITHFTKHRLTREQWNNAWRLCGPSAEKNMERLELWQVIASAYLEGLSHGADAARSCKPTET